MYVSILYTHTDTACDRTSDGVQRGVPLLRALDPRPPPPQMPVGSHRSENPTSAP